MSSPVGTTGPPKPGAKVTDPKIAEIKKTFTPNQISKVQGFITSAVNDTLRSSFSRDQGTISIIFNRFTVH